jgi:hypothetical protein
MVSSDVFNEIEQLLSSKMQIDACRFGRCLPSQLLVRIDEVLDDATQVKKRSCAIATPKVALRHRLICQEPPG